MRKEFEINICWRAFPLHPDTPLEGLTLEALFAGRSLDIQAMLARLHRIAAELNLPFGKREKTYNSRLAQELGKWAESKQKGDAYHRAVFEAYFAQGRNIGKIETLIDLGAALGFSEQSIRETLGGREYQAAVDQDWSRAHTLGVTAVPTLMLHRQPLVGAQPYEKMAVYLESHAVKRRRGPGGSLC